MSSPGYSRTEMAFRPSRYTTSGLAAACSTVTAQAISSCALQAYRLLIQEYGSHLPSPGLQVSPCALSGESSFLSVCSLCWLATSLRFEASWRCRLSSLIHMAAEASYYGCDVGGGSPCSGFDGCSNLYERSACTIIQMGLLVGIDHTRMLASAPSRNL